MVIHDMVYQGIVLGPLLWNILSEDAAKAIRLNEFCEIVFADDLKAYKAFTPTTGNQALLSELKEIPMRGTRLRKNESGQLRRK